MIWNRLLGIIMFFFLFGLPAKAEQEIRIIDLEGKTQSIVEIDDSVPDQTVATVRVSLTSPEEASDPALLESLKGVEISLIKVTGGREGDVVQTAKTFKNGVATFNSIPPGMYKARIECEQMIVLNSTVSGAAVVDRSAGQAPPPESLDQLHLIDQQGSTRALGEIPLGQSADVTITVGDSTQENKPSKDIRVLLIEVEPDTEEEMEVYAAQFSDSDGVTKFSNVPGGVYKVRMECNKYGLGGIRFGGASVLSCTCPINFIPGATNAVAELATPVSSLSLTTVAPAVAAPATTGAVVAPKDTGGDEPPSKSVIDSETK